MSYGLGFKIAPVNIAAQAGVAGTLIWKQDEPKTTFSAKGLLFHDGSQRDKQLNDYYTEQDDPYSDRLLYTSIPFANFDAYNISGEGLGGSFRYMPHQLRAFFPNFSSRKINTGSLGLDFNIGNGVTIGINAGITGQTQKVSSDTSINNGVGLPTISDRLSWYWMSGNLGGAVIYNDSSLTVPDYNSALLPKVKDSFWNRSTLIQPRLFKDDVGSNPDFAAQAKSYFLPYLDSSLAKMVIRTKNGDIQEYGIPVLAKSEVCISVGTTQKPVTGSTIYDNLL